MSDDQLALLIDPFVAELVPNYFVIEPEAHLLALVQKGVFRPQDPMSAAIIGAIRSGLVASPFTKREFKGSLI